MIFPSFRDPCFLNRAEYGRLFVEIRARAAGSGRAARCLPDLARPEFLVELVMLVDVEVR